LRLIDQKPSLDSEQGDRYLQIVKTLLATHSEDNILSNNIIVQSKINEEIPEEHKEYIGRLVAYACGYEGVDLLKTKESFEDLQQAVFAQVETVYLTNASNKYFNQLVPHLNDPDKSCVASYELDRVAEAIIEVHKVDASSTPDSSAEQSAQSVLMEDLHHLMIGRRVFEDEKAVSAITEQLMGNAEWLAILDDDPAIKKKTAEYRKPLTVLSLEISPAVAALYKTECERYFPMFRTNEKPIQKMALGTWMKNLYGTVTNDELNYLTALRNYYQNHPDKEPVTDIAAAKAEVSASIEKEIAQKVRADKASATAAYLETLFGKAQALHPLSAGQVEIVSKNGYTVVPVLDQQSRAVEPLQIQRNHGKITSVLVRRLDGDKNNVQVVPASWIAPADLTRMKEIIKAGTSENLRPTLSKPKRVQIELKKGKAQKTGGINR